MYFPYSDSELDNDSICDEGNESNDYFGGEDIWLIWNHTLTLISYRKLGRENDKKNSCQAAKTIIISQFLKWLIHSIYKITLKVITI